MALPSDKINTSLVKTTIGASTNDVGGLCVHPSVNKWSKWKPVRWNKVDGITLANLEAINYGISYSSYANIDAVKQAYQSGTDGWVYQKPRGGALEPYRLGDFRNYEHSAIAPIAGAGATSRVQNIQGGQTTISGYVILNGFPKAGEIGWDDLVLDQRKLAIALYSDRDVLLKTAVATNIGDTEVLMDTRDPLPFISEGFYTAIVFFTNNAGTTNGDLIGVPGHHPFGYPVEVISFVVFVSLTARWSQSNPNQIIYEVFGVNKAGVDATLLNCSIRVRNSANDCASIIQQYEQLINIGNLVIPNTGTAPQLLYSSTVTVNREVFMSWKMCWTNGGAYPHSFSSNILEEMD